MHKIIFLTVAALAIQACGQTSHSKSSDISSDVASADGICSGIPKPEEFLPKAEAGDEDAMGWAAMYYGMSECGAPKLDVAKELYWKKKSADLGNDADNILSLINTLNREIDPKNHLNSDSDVMLDPHLLKVWMDKYCAISNVDVQCKNDGTPYWTDAESWKKLLSSPPRTDDINWYKYLPKGCEQGQCLAK